MRDKLGVLLVEEEDGSIAVQLFSDPDNAKGSFDNLNGKEGQAPQRATFLNLYYKGDGVVMKDFVAKNLPVVVEKEDAWRIGEGPVSIPEEIKGDKNES